jgi:hypothetical protein
MVAAAQAQVSHHSSSGTVKTSGLTSQEQCGNTFSFAILVEKRLLECQYQDRLGTQCQNEKLKRRRFCQATKSARTEILHEAHTHGSTDGNGNALRVDDYKIVIRTGQQWSTGSHLGTNDGWYGGPTSSDSKTGAYGVSIGKADEGWVVKCPPPPQNVTDGFACEQAKGAGADQPEFTCLFNIAEDPCEMTDLSGSQPQRLKEMLARLDAFRATSVVSTVATANPDGHACPANVVASKESTGTPTSPGGCSGGGVEAPMNCTTQLPCTPGPDK